MPTANKKLLKKRDLIIILIITLLSLLCLAIIKFTLSDGVRAVVSVDGKKLSEYNLNKDTEFTLIKADGAIIEIKKGQIRLKSSDCPDKICVKTGYISKDGEKIVCLPKKLIIEIE